MIAACLIVLGCLHYPALHVDTVSHTLPGLEYARTGLLESPIWHLTYLFSPDGGAGYYYHGFLHQVLLGRLGIKELPQAVSLIGWMNGVIVIVFSFIHLKILSRSALSRGTRLPQWPQLAASQLALALPLSAWLLYLQGRPETLCLLIMALTSAVLLLPSTRSLDAIVLGIGTSLCLLTSPAFGVNAFLLSLTYFVLRCRWSQLLRCTAILSCVTALSTALLTVALFPGHPLALVSGIRDHSTLIGGRSLSLIPRIWIKSWRFPGLGLLLATSLLCIGLNVRKLPIEAARRLLLYALFTVLCIILYKTSISFSHRNYNASPLIAVAIMYLAWLIGSARRITPWVAALLVLSFTPGLGFAKHLSQAADYQLNGTKWSELKQATQAIEATLSPGEVIGFSAFSPVAWAGLSDFNQGRSQPSDPQQNLPGPPGQPAVSQQPLIRIIFKDTPLINTAKFSQPHQIQKVGTGGLGYDYGATVVKLDQ